MSDTQQHITNTYAARILDSSAAGRSMLTAADDAAQRTLLSVLSTAQIVAAYQPLGDYATGAEGDLATSAVQPGDLATVATTGAYSDLISPPTLGTAAGADTGDFAAATHSHSTSDITSGTFADARIAESNVTQHQAALSITESQISDLGTYATVASLGELAALDEDELTLVESAPIFLSPQDSDATAATNVVDFVVPFAMSLTSVEFRCREGNPPTGAAAQMDCLLAGTTIFSTNPTIDTGEFSSTTAATPPVLSASPTALTAGQRLQFDLDQVGASDAGRGYYCIIRGTRVNT